jgi:hypothetical protein
MHFGKSVVVPASIASDRALQIARLDAEKRYKALLLSPTVGTSTTNQKIRI